MTPARDDGHLRYLLTAYLFGNLSDDGRAEVESHLSECAACRAELEELRETRALVEEALALPGAGAGGGEGAADETAPAAPYSFEAHRLERVLAAGRRGGFAWGRAAWYSAAALFFFALTAWLVLPNLITARRGGGRSLPNLTQSASPLDDPRIVSELRDTPEDIQFHGGESAGLGLESEAEGRRGELAAGGQGGGSESYRLGRSDVAPPTSTPAPASPMPEPVLADQARPQLRSAEEKSARLVETAASPPGPRPLTIQGVASAPTGEPTHRIDAGSAGAVPGEGYVLATDYDQKSPAAGSKLDADDARHGRDRAAAAAEPARKPAAPPEEAAGKRILEESARAGELREDRADYAKKEHKDASRDAIEIDGTLPPTDAEKSKKNVFYGIDARKKRDSGPLPVIDLIQKSVNEAASNVTPEWKESDRRMPEGERQVEFQEYAGERMNKPRFHRSAQELDDASVDSNPPNGSLSELREADKNPAGIYAYGADAPAAETSSELVDQERSDVSRIEAMASAGYPVDTIPGNRRLTGGGSAPPETRVELGFIEVEESLEGLQEPLPTKVPALNLMRGLQNQTGLPVNYPTPGKESYGTVEGIEILGGDITLNPPLIAALLETNDYEIRRERLPDGSDVLNIRRDGTTNLGEDDATLAIAPDPAVHQALLAAVQEQAPQLGYRFAPTPFDPATLRFGLVLRAPRSTLEQVQRAVELAESGAVAQDPGALAGWFSGVLAGTISPLPGSDLAQRAESRADEERTLRAYDHYKRNDPALDHRTFAARRLPVPAPVIGDEGLGQEGFRERYGVNPFVETERDRFSTFAMDVDTASYTRARTMIAEGRLPDPGAVRTEEFVNAFPDPRAADPSRAFSVFCEGGPSPFGLAAGRDAAREASADAPQVEQVQITVKARDLAPGERRPAILTFAIDTSGSMHHGARLDLVRAALSVLLDGLAPDDRVGIVAYGTQAYLVLPHTPARERGRIAGALDSLSCHGATNVEAGLDLAYRLADEVAHTRAANRVIVCSDGVATSGERDAQALLRKVRVYADRGIYLSVVGFGAGRYDDAFLERIANQGNGQYGYVNSIDDAVRLFADNLPAALSVLARDAKIQVDFDPAVVRQYRLLGYENRDVKDEDFRNDKIDAGEVGPGSTVTAIYEVVRRPASAGDLGRVHLRYHDTSLGRVEEIDFPIPPGVIATRLEGTSERFRLLASVAELAELLRGSYFARDGAFSAVLGTLATLSPATTARPEVREFIDMSLGARDLSLERWAKE